MIKEITIKQGKLVCFYNDSDPSTNELTIYIDRWKEIQKNMGSI